MEKPFLSVIVVAHDRKEFLKEALRSVTQQSIDKSLFEIVLITNFPVDEDLFAIPNLTHLISESKGLELKIAEGLRQCKGEIVCFLEDDDAWEAGKLDKVVTIFKSNPDTGFYHNHFTIVDEKGNRAFHVTLSTMHRRMKRAGSLRTNKQEARYGEIRKMVKIGVNFNLSCMSIRRSVINRYSDYLNELKGQNLNVDTFVFYASLLSGKTLIADSDELTRHRIHGDKTSRHFITANTTPRDLGFSTLLRMTEGTEENKTIRRSIDCMISDLTFEIYSASNIRSRSLMAKAIVNHMRYFSRYDVQYDALLVLYGLLYFVSPRLGDFMHSIPESHL